MTPYAAATSSTPNPIQITAQVRSPNSAGLLEKNPERKKTRVPSKMFQKPVNRIMRPANNNHPSASSSAERTD